MPTWKSIFVWRRCRLCRSTFPGTVSRNRYIRGCTSITGTAAGRRRFHAGREPADLGPDPWQGLFEHGRLRAGQSVIAHGAAGAVGSIVTQLAREAGAYVIGTGRAADRRKALDFGAQEFVDLENDALERPLCDRAHRNSVIGA